VDCCEGWRGGAVVEVFIVLGVGVLGVGVLGVGVLGVVVLLV